MAECCDNTNENVKLLYACSGAANTGYPADAVTRRLAKQGIGKLTCLSAMGGGLSGSWLQREPLRLTWYSMAA